VPVKNFIPFDHSYFAVVYFDAQKNHQEADSGWSEPTQVGVN